MPRRRALVALAAGLLAGCASAPPALPPAVRQALAPTGTLRIAVYPGSPTSLLPGEPPRGVAVDVGRALAARLGVPSELVVLPRVAEVVAALKAGRADFTVTNATPARAAEVDFTPPLLALELGLLVPAGSAVASLETIDRDGVRVGVSQGSSSERALAGRWQRAKLVSEPTLDAAAADLKAGRLDAFATNKGILFELADRVPGSRVLEGRWGLEHLAIAVPQGREAARAELQRFAMQVASDGTVAAAAARAGLRGTVPPETR
ncbi:MAG: transporter substrate-binding domain-containing protein [Rubrivivax sp.]